MVSRIKRRNLRTQRSIFKLKIVFLYYIIVFMYEALRRNFQDIQFFRNKNQNSKKMTPRIFQKF